MKSFDALNTNVNLLPGQSGSNTFHTAVSLGPLGRTTQQEKKNQHNTTHTQHTTEETTQHQQNTTEQNRTKNTYKDTTHTHHQQTSVHT